jgi:hypothetical protein
MPTICSAEMFAAMSDAPIAHHGSDFEARKYSELSFALPPLSRDTHCARPNMPIAYTMTTIRSIPDRLMHVPLPSGSRQLQARGSKFIRQIWKV